MERLDEIARRHDLLLIEDAAHAVGASYRGHPLGSLGSMATVSFHETKSPQCGEGGALLVNRPDLVARAEVIQEKGTDRSRFFRGEIDKYTWQDLGSSYLLSEVAAAFLWGQLEHADPVTAERQRIWQRYDEALEPLEEDGLLRRPIVPPGCVHSGHLYYVLMPTAEARDEMLSALRERGVNAVFHYLPLSSSPGGSRFGRTGGPVPVTADASARLLRLPLWAGLTEAQLDTVIGAVADCARAVSATALA
jgi:dTDP-4-amino-4,6-dideoxygalactose transaminase